MEHAHLLISGMSCGHCISNVSRALEAIPGVTPGDVRVGAADVDYDPAQTTEVLIAQAVSTAGYPARIG